MCGPWERRKRNADEAKKRNQNDKGLGCPRIDKVHASQGVLVGFGKGIVGWRVTEGGFGGGLLKEEGGMACRNGPPATAAVTRPVLRCLSVGAICAYPLAPWHRATGGNLEEGGGGNVAEHRDRRILWQWTRERFANEMAATRADGRNGRRGQQRCGGSGHRHYSDGKKS